MTGLLQIVKNKTRETCISESTQGTGFRTASLDAFLGGFAWHPYSAQTFIFTHLLWVWLVLFWGVAAWWNKGWSQMSYTLPSEIVPYLPCPPESDCGDGRRSLSQLLPLPYDLIIPLPRNSVPVCSFRHWPALTPHVCRLHRLCRKKGPWVSLLGLQCLS